MRQLRAVLVLTHLVVMLLLAIPYPPPGLRGGRAVGSTEAGIQTWTRAGSKVGISPDAVEAAIRGFSAVQLTAVRAIRGGLRPYVDLLGVRQEWLMFGEVPDRSARIEIEVHTPEGWVPLYVRGDPTAIWHRDLFDEERLRTLFSGFGKKQGRADYDRVVDWLATRVDRPDADQVRVQLRKIFIPPAPMLRDQGHLTVGKEFWAIERPVSR